MSKLSPNFDVTNVIVNDGTEQFASFVNNNNHCLKTFQIFPKQNQVKLCCVVRFLRCESESFEIYLTHS